MTTIRLTDDSTLYVPHGEVSTKVWYLLPLRLYIGFQFMLASFRKIAERMLTQSERFSEYIEHAQAGSGGALDSLYDRFLDSVIQPNIAFFAMAIILGQLLIGFGLFVGAFTRLFAFLGFVYMANVFFLREISVFYPHYSVIFMLILLVLFLTNAGLAYGLDHRLKGRFPSWLV